MRAAALLTLTGLALAAVPAFADDAKTVRPLDIKILPVTAEGPFGKPAVVGTAEELEKLIPDKDTRAAITKAVDLTKESLVMFAWSGSGGDKLTFVVEKGEKGPVVVFGLTRGLTRDLRQHVHTFAVSKDATWTLKK